MGSVISLKSTSVKEKEKKNREIKEKGKRRREKRQWLHSKFL